ncbi:MAG: alginate export family protein [Sphingobacterium sp.]
MKKSLIIVLSMLLVMGFAVSAFAIHATMPAETNAVVAPKGTEIRLGGEIRIRGWYRDNVTNDAGTANAESGRPYSGGSMSKYDERVRINIDAKLSPNVSGRLQLQTSSTTWGVTNTATNDGGRLLGDGGIRFREAWIAYTGTGLLGVTAGLKLGHMPFMIGAGEFVDHRPFGDDAIVLWIEPAKGTDITLSSVKVYESSVTGRNRDDWDMYTLMVAHKLDKDNTIGLDLSLGTTSDMDVTTAPYTGHGDAEMNLWNLGLNAKGKVAGPGLGYNASIDLQFGNIKDITVAPEKRKFRGYGIVAGLNYMVDPVTLRGMVAYGSGDKIDSADKNEGFQVFGAIDADLGRYTVVYDGTVTTAAHYDGTQGIQGRTRGTGIANTTIYNMGLTVSPMKDVTARLDYFLLRASKKLSNTADAFGNSKKIGSELDLRLSYKLGAGLTYFINSGILFAGDFYKAAATGITSDPKNAVVAQHGVTLVF